MLRNSREFKELLGEWNKKLEESGFKDAEKDVAGERVLKQTADYAFRETSRSAASCYLGAPLGIDSGSARPGYSHNMRSAESFESRRNAIEGKRRYFELIAQHFCQEMEFDDEWDRLIMEMTAEGSSIKEISDKLKSLKPESRERTKHNRDTIRYVRRRYEHRWGIKVWLPHQMQSRKVPTR